KNRLGRSQFELAAITPGSGCRNPTGGVCSYGGISANLGRDGSPSRDKSEQVGERITKCGTRNIRPVAGREGSDEAARSFKWSRSKRAPDGGKQPGISIPRP